MNDGSTGGWIIGMSRLNAKRTKNGKRSKKKGETIVQIRHLYITDKLFSGMHQCECLCRYTVHTHTYSGKTVDISVS